MTSGRSGVRGRLYLSVAVACLLAGPAVAQSLADPSVKAGAATINGIGSTNVAVRQTTDKAVIDWRAFSVDSGTKLTFVQPDATSITLNRITGDSATRIDGNLTANGQVWLLNPNGVLIGAGGRLAVGGLLATTHTTANADFLSGNYRFDGAGATGDVRNSGVIVAHGYAVLAGNHVANDGLVQARLGKVVLGAGSSYVLDIAGDKLLSFAVTAPVAMAGTGIGLVENSGTLSARGGNVLLTARGAADVVGSVVNTTGLIDASAARRQGGVIVLDGGDAGLVYAGGTLDASGKRAGQTGGAVKIHGDTVVVGANALVDASGSAGGGKINVGGGWQGAAIDGHASAVRAGVAAGATLDASALDRGNGGEITLWSDVHNAASQTYAAGTFLARAGAQGGDGGRIETSGHYLDAARATGSASAPLGRAGTWLFDPFDVEIVASTPLPQIVNPGFENGLVGWTVTGTGGAAEVVTSATAAGAGSGPGFIAPGGMVYTSQVSSGGNFLLASGGDNGSNNGVTQTFSGTANDAFTMYGLFLGKDRASSNDYVFVRLMLPDGTSQALYLKNSAGVGDFGTSPWESVRYTLPQTGTYTIYATSTNLGDNLMPSQLGFEIGAALNSASGAFANSGFGHTWTPNGAASKVDVAQITGFLNAGTNVQITTGTGGNEAGNITVNAAIAKTAGTNAMLRLDALNGIFVNQAITSTAGTLDVMMNSGAGGIALNGIVATNGGVLTLNSSGRTTQTAALTAASLVLNGTGPHTLFNAGNSFGTVSGSTGEAQIFSAGATGIAGLSVTGTFTLASSGMVTLTGLNSFGTGGAFVTPGAIWIGGGSQTTTAGILALEAGTDFVNQAGANAITTTGGGRWLIYSQGPAGNTFNGLTSGNIAVWNQIPDTLPPGIAPAGNRYIFAQSPTLTVTASDARKIYGDTLGGANRPFTVSGLIDAAAFGNVFLQDTVSGTPQISSLGDGARAIVAAYGLGISQGSLVVPQGYGVNYAATGTLTIDPRSLLLSAVGASKVYDGTTLSSDAPTATGLVNGDTIDNLAQSYDSRNAGNRTLAVNASYVVQDGYGGRNYSVTISNAAGAITAKALSTSLIGSVTKTYDGTTVAMLDSGNYALAGVIVGDAVALNGAAAGSYSDRNVGAGKTVTVSGLALSGADAGNYTVNAAASAAIGTMLAKQLSASLTGGVTKIYDGTTAALLGANNYTLAGVVLGDAVILTAPAAGLYADRNVGTGKVVTASGLALSGANAGNYAVNAAATGTIGAIDARQLTASLTGGVVKTYDGSATAALTAGNYSLTGVVTGDAVALSIPATGAYADPNAGTGKAVTAFGLFLGGADAGNYFVNGTATAAIGTISPKALTAMLTGSVVKNYDGTTAARLSAGNFALAGFVAGQSGGIVATSGQYATPNAGGDILVSVSLTPGDFVAGGGTLLGNYVLPTGVLSGRVGSITPQVVVPVVIIPVPPPAVVAAASAVATSILPPASATPIAATVPARADFAAPSAGSATTVLLAGMAVTPSPPSPIATTKPATPVDAVDSSDPILALVDPSPDEHPASGAARRGATTTIISPGLLSAQPASPARTAGLPGIDDSFSGSGNIF